jgi:hypothetical protein
VEEGHTSDCANILGFTYDEINSQKEDELVNIYLLQQNTIFNFLL